MSVFCRVVELGSFVAAAKDQNISPAIVGRHVSDLETYLNQRLIIRTTRSMDVTEAGQKYYQGCKTMLDQISALEQDASAENETEVTGVIRLAAPEGIGSPVLLNVIESFQIEHSQVQFDLVLNNDQTDFVSSKVDLAVRLAISLEDSTLIIRKMAETRLRLFAAPEYLNRNGTPKTVDDLEDHACISFGGSRFGDSWPIVSKTGLRKLRMPWKLVVNQTHVFRDSLVRGMGIGLLPEVMASQMLRDGTLVPVVLDVNLPEVGVFAVYPNRAFQPKRVRMFLEHLATSLKMQVG